MSILDGIFGGGQSVPNPPPLSGPERRLLASQGYALDEILSLLSDEKVNSKEAQNLFKELSGLYTTTNEPLKDVIDQDKAKAYFNTRGDGGKFRQTGSFEDWLARLESDEGLSRAKRLGLVKQVGGETKTLNPEAVKALREKLTAYSDIEAQFQNRYNDVQMQILDRTDKALRGELPIPEATLEQERRDFAAMKNTGARMGWDIAGDNLETATANTTAGAQLLAEQKSRYKALKDAQARGEIDASLNNAGMGFNLRANYNPVPELGYVTGASSVGPSRLIPSYSGAVESMGFMMQPYTNQRLMQYQGQLQNAANQNAYGNSLLGLGGQLGAAWLIGRR